MSASSIPRPALDDSPADAFSDHASFLPHTSHNSSAKLRLDTAQALPEQYSPQREPVSPLDEADVDFRLPQRANGNVSHYSHTQLEPVSPLAMSRRASVADADAKVQDSTVNEPKLDKHSKKAAAAEPRSVTLAETPISPNAAQFASNSIHPPPAYVAESGAVQVVTEHQQAQGEHVDFQPDLSFSPGALALVNAFLDYILYGCLANARATTLTALRPAVIEVLKQRVAREAIASAEDELHELLAGNEEEEDMNEEQNAADWDLDLIWRRTRLRVMVYIRLGEMEDEDEERFVDEEDLLHGSDRSFSRSTGLVSWAAAIFLTSVLEYLAEQSLQIAGQAAFSRALRPTRATAASPDRQLPTAIVVEDSDAEKIALSSSLGRIWRTWRKSLRTGGSSRSGIRFPVPRSGAMTPSSVANSSVDPRDRSLSIATHKSEDKYVDAQEQTEPADPADIPLPMSDERTDVDEIEVPGLATDPDAVTQSEDVPAKRRQSFALPPTRTFASGQEDDKPDVTKDNNKPVLVRQRSISVPMPVRPALVSGAMPGTFPTESDPGSTNIEVDAATSEASVPIGPGGDTQVNGATPGAAAAAKVAATAAVLGNATSVESNEAQAVVQDTTTIGTNSERQAGSVVESVSHHEPSAGVPQKSEDQADTAPLPVKGATRSDTTVRQSAKTLAGFDRSARNAVGSTAAGGAAAALTAAVAAYSFQAVQASNAAANSASVVPPPQQVERVEAVKSPELIKTSSPVRDENPTSQPLRSAKATVSDATEAVPKAQHQVAASLPTLPRHLDSTSKPSAEEPRSVALAASDSPSRSGSEYSQTSITHDGQAQPHSLPNMVDVEADKAAGKKIDSVHSATPASEARDIQVPRSGKSSASEGALAAIPASAAALALQPQKSSEKLRSTPFTAPPAAHGVRSPAANNEDLWQSPPKPSNTPVKTTVKILPPQVQHTSLATSNPRPRQKPIPPFSLPSVSRIPETEVPRDSYFQSTPQSPKSPISSKSPTKSESEASLTSAAIRAPEDFDAFVQNSETVKYTLTPDTIRDDSQKDRMLLLKHSTDHTDYSAKFAANGKALSPTLKTDTWANRSSAVKSSTPVVSPAEESPRSPRLLWPLGKEKRQSVARPEPQNIKSPGKSGLLAREPRVQTDSMRDFADFIRSTGPPKNASPVGAPVGSPQATRSATSLQTYRPGGSKSASRDSLPALPDNTSNRVREFLQPRNPTVEPKPHGALVDFIRSGPPEDGQHRIPRAVAPFRSTLDSDEFTEWSDKMNPTPAIGFNQAERQGFASQTSKNTSAPAVKSVFKDDSGRTRYRNKDLYDMDWIDDDDYEDKRGNMIASLPQIQQDALTRILSGGNAPVDMPTSTTRPMTNGSSSTAPPVRTMSQSSRFSSFRQQLRAEASANNRALMNFLDGGPEPGEASPIKTKASLPSVREDWDSRPGSKQSKTKRGFFGFGRR